MGGPERKLKLIGELRSGTWNNINREAKEAQYRGPRCASRVFYLCMFLSA